MKPLDVLGYSTLTVIVAAYSLASISFAMSEAKAGVSAGALASALEDVVLHANASDDQGASGTIDFLDDRTDGISE
jgi:hypothetical protein